MSVNARRLLESEEIGDVMVVRFCIESIREDRDIFEIFGQLEQLVTDGCYKLVLSFHGIEAIASYAIGRLVALNQRIKERAGTLIVCALPEIVSEIVHLMRLDRKLRIRRTEQDALQSF